MKEQWKDILNYEGVYQVSNLGSVKRIKTFYGNPRSSFLKPQNDGKGYMRVRLYKYPNPPKFFRVHQVVMRAFVGAYPPGKEINHNDGNRANNRLDNLSYITKSENCLHMYRVLGAKPNRKGCKKLHKAEVLEIRQLYTTKEYTQIQLGIMFNVNRNTIGGIVRKQTWKHLL